MGFLPHDVDKMERVRLLIGLTGPGFGKCRARCSAPVTPLAAHPVSVWAAVRVCGWGRIHPLPHVCPPPAGGRPPVQLFCLRWRYGITLRPIRRVVARRPRGSVFPVPHGRPHGGGGGRSALVRSFLPSRVLRCHKGAGSRTGNRRRSAVE
jgi:hypothetical protein